MDKIGGSRFGCWGLKINISFLDILEIPSVYPGGDVEWVVGNKGLLFRGEVLAGHITLVVCGRCLMSWNCMWFLAVRVSEQSFEDQTLRIPAVRFREIRKHQWRTPWRGAEKRGSGWRRLGVRKNILNMRSIVFGAMEMIQWKKKNRWCRREGQLQE